MFGIANLRPEDTGLVHTIHVYKNEDSRARHGPRIKVFPGKPHEGNATIITIPRTERDTPEVIGKLTISARAARIVSAFARANYLALLAYWYEADFDERDLRTALEED